MIGDTLDGKYRIRRVIGAGGMGTVYEADDLAKGGIVAVKVLDLSGLPEKKCAGAIARFEREARAAGSIDTDHIVRVFDAGTDPASGKPFMAMEHLVGEDAQQAFQRLGPMPPDLAMRITAQACIGLDKAHQAGVVHRDIKPANLFLSRRGGGGITVKLLDFGVAKIAEEESGIAPTAGLTRTGSMLGSPLYMAPEQARGAKNVDHRADIWALGVVLYQGLAGRAPYQHVEAFGELIIAICSNQPPPVQRFAPWVTPELAEIVDGALRVEAAERYASAAVMLNALLTLLPEGFALSEWMLRSIDNDARATTAARFSRQTLTETQAAPVATVDTGSSVDDLSFKVTRPLESTTGQRAVPDAVPPSLGEKNASRDVLPPSLTRAELDGGLGPLARPPPSRPPSFHDAMYTPTPPSAPSRPSRLVVRIPEEAASLERLPLRDQLRHPLLAVGVALGIAALEWTLRPLATLGSEIPMYTSWAAKGLMMIGFAWAFVRVFLLPLHVKADR